jgi:hypothetical protein
MTSIQGSLKQIPRNANYYIPISSIVTVSTATPVVFISDLDGNGNLSTAGWAVTPAYAGQPGNGKYTSSLNAGQGRLRDMGTYILSAGRTFRKVQLVVNNGALTANQSTFGVAGPAGVANSADGYLTGYIELGWEGSGVNAPVARFG